MVLWSLSLIPTSQALEFTRYIAPEATKENIVDIIQLELQPIAASYVNFPRDIQTEKIQYTKEIFPENYPPYIPAHIPSQTPEEQLFSEKIGKSQWESLTSEWYDREKPILIHTPSTAVGYNFGFYEEDGIPLRSHEEIEKRNMRREIDGQWNTTKTNTQNTELYRIFSPKEQTITIQIFPVTNRQYIYGGESLLESVGMYPAYSLDPSFTTSFEERSTLPLLVLMSSLFDFYDIRVWTDGDDFTTSYPTQRKVSLNIFQKGKLIYPKENVFFGRDRYSLTPYYEVNVPLKKWENTLKVSYKNWTIATIDEPVVLHK